MKKIFTSFTLLFFFSLSGLFAECVLVPLSLKDRTDASSLIIEGAVVAKKSQWTSDGAMIITINTIDIAKIYKGSNLITTTKLDVVTLGGTVGDKAVKVEPELELEIGQIGVLMLVSKDNQWVSESGPQGFIQFDKHSLIATDVFNTFNLNQFKKDIVELVGLSPVSINPGLTEIKISSKRASPTISSISPTSINAGTSSVLTIKGTNFNALIDTSSVQFKNGDDGGATYIKALKRDYISWSDTMIRVMVRTKAGTGKIRLVIKDNGTVISSDTLKIAYAHLNVVQGDTISYETQEIGMNNNNGITWKMNQRFYDSIGARGAFVRSLERWRCGTFINWDTLGHVSHSAIRSDGINMCAWDTSSAMPSGVLAQCFSFWSGCFTPGLKWYVNELDIRFRIKPTNSTNWNYTTGNASGSQFHFESVATHELGHGHQLGHVINSAVVMHFSIANGQTKPNLSANDVSGGTYVINKSATSICGKNAHTKLNSGNCAIVAPNAHFRMSRTSICKNETITFTDSSQGNISAYSWNFGANATPATANTKGPHNVSYSAGGTKNISLTITTLNGNLNTSRNLNVSNDSKIIPNFTTVAAEKGRVTFSNTSNNPISTKWYFGDGDSSDQSNVTHTYTNGGTYNVKLVSSNTCNEDDTSISLKLAYLNFGSLSDLACINQTVVYVDSSDNNVASWSWSFPGGTPATASGKGPHNVYYMSAGLKSATLTIGVTGSPNQIYTRNNLININTDTFTKASFIYGYYGKNIVGFSNNSEGSGMIYKWYFGDGDSSSEKSPVHTYNNANNQVVRLIVSGNCGTDDTTITLRDFTSISSFDKPTITIYPNPAQNEFSISGLENYPAVYAIFDMNGRLVNTGNITGSQPVNVKDIESGIYTLMLKTTAGNHFLQLILQ